MGKKIKKLVQSYWSRIRKTKKIIAETNLFKSGLKLKYTALGEPVIIPLNTKDTESIAKKYFHFHDWSISELRAIADYMESHPDCSLMSDGSGKEVKL